MKIIRIEHNLFFDTYGTFGRLTLDGWTCFTVEKPWLHNRANISRIPSGVYVIKIGDFRGKYPNYELQDVKGRTAIEIHIANFQSELRGCIGLGDSVSWFPARKLYGVTNSKKTHEEFMRRMDGDKMGVISIFTLSEAAA